MEKELIFNSIFDRFTYLPCLLGMEWKFSIIQRLVKHPEECSGLIGDEEYIKLNVYVREGIFFKESNVTVAVSDRAA